MSHLAWLIPFKVPCSPRTCPAGFGSSHVFIAHWPFVGVSSFVFAVIRSRSHPFVCVAVHIDLFASAFTAGYLLRLERLIPP